MSFQNIVATAKAIHADIVDEFGPPKKGGFQQTNLY